jgi:hypothetical protein
LLEENVATTCSPQEPFKCRHAFPIDHPSHKPRVKLNLL